MNKWTQGCRGRRSRGERRSSGSARFALRLENASLPRLTSQPRLEEARDDVRLSPGCPCRAAERARGWEPPSCSWECSEARVAAEPRGVSL